MTTEPDRESARKPILLTVDDDPGVSRAVARDLRRHYGEGTGWCAPSPDRLRSKVCAS